MRKFLAVAATATFGLLTGLFSMDVIALRRSSAAPAPAVAVVPLTEPAPAPTARVLKPRVQLAPEPAISEQERWIAAEAEKLAARFRDSEGEDSILFPFDEAYRSQAEFVVDASGTGRWITLTAARVPCAELDRYLAERNDPGLGAPDQCARWNEQARKVLRRHGVRGAAATRFLEASASDPDMRVLLVYAGWKAVPGNPQRVELADARAAAVYPQSDFTKRRREALDQIYRSMRLGPYSKE